MFTVAAEAERRTDLVNPRRRTLLSDAIRSYSANRLAVFSLILVVLLVLTAVFANFIAPTPYDRSVLTEALEFPSLRHLLGTDQIGRDFLSRIIYGARISMTVGFTVQIIAFSIGMPLGALAGLRGGKVDFVVMRLVEMMTAFPGILFAILIMSILGTGMWNVILAISVASWIGPCRLMRGQVLALREKEYVTVARAIGTGEVQILWRHILPNALPPLIVMLTLSIPAAMFAEAGLSFLGLGISDPIPSWGKMVGTSLSYMPLYWHLGLFPTIMIAMTMLSFAFVGDGLRDALDPTMRI